MKGTIKFSEIPKLQDGWEKGSPINNPSNVWKIWDENTYYLWGANHHNITGIAIGKSLKGGGMAGVDQGPTRGLAHPHYIGVNTMEYVYASDNDTVFIELTKLVNSGKDVVVPIFHDSNAPSRVYKYSLGTGIGHYVQNWADIQKHIFQLLLQLCKVAESVDFPVGIYWPDFRNDNGLPHYPITSLDDIQSIIDALNE
jgi:hypothetical protein